MFTVSAMDTANRLGSKINVWWTQPNIMTSATTAVYSQLLLELPQLLYSCIPTVHANTNLTQLQHHYSHSYSTITATATAPLQPQLQHHYSHSYSTTTATATAPLQPQLQHHYSHSYSTTTATVTAPLQPQLHCTTAGAVLLHH